MKHETTTYHCDKCGRKLPSYRNALDIVTDLSTSKGGPWARLHVAINHRSGVHNDAATRPADLCKECTIGLLMDALARIKKGERATAGTEDIEIGRWIGCYD